MRLLKFGPEGTICFTKDLVKDIPPYAILSHTWGFDEDEVTYDDINKNSGADKHGYAKILFCMRQAATDGYEYSWVDTCCIHKTNHVELSEAIVSMYRWYQDAAKCYVYLSDVSAGAGGLPSPEQPSEAAIRNSRWFTRGFTLQELLAPSVVEFFSVEGVLLGSKKTLEMLIADITGIPAGALQGADLAQFSIDERLTWTMGRDTQRVEDKAYCLLGVFGIFMPLIYGEGENAFKRLRNEIDKQSRSQTVPVNARWLVTRLPNPFYTGREDLLQEVRTIITGALKCPPNQEQCRIVIHGLGGQGKSEFCLQLAHRLQRSFWAVFWIDVSTVSIAEASFVKLARQLSIPAQTCEEACIGIANLQQTWLLVLDNDDDPNVDYTPFIPFATSGVVMITSRGEDFQQYATVKSFLIEGLSKLDARALLLKAARIPTHQHDLHELEADQVSELLHTHPLALLQAAAYVSCGHCTLSRYPDVYKQQRQRLLTFRPKKARSRYGDVYATFEVSAQVLESSCDTAAQDALELLSLLALCAPNQVPITLFEIGWNSAQIVKSGGDDGPNNDDHWRVLLPWHIEHLPPIIRRIKTTWDPFPLVEAIQLLKAFGLVTVESATGNLTVSMHPLTHAWARDRISEVQQRESWLRMACLLAFVTEIHDYWFRHKYQLQPHVETLAASFTNDITLAGPPEMIIGLLAICGDLLIQMGSYSQASDLLENMIAFYSLDPTHIDQRFMVIYFVMARGLVIGNGDSSVAVPLLQSLLKPENSSAMRPTQRLLVQRELGSALYEIGRFEEAVVLLEDVVATSRQFPTSKLLLDSLQELARAYHKNFQNQAAAELLEEVVRVQRRTLSEGDMSRLGALTHLGLIYTANGQYESALHALEEVDSIQGELLPKNHHTRLYTQQTMAVLHKDMGNPAKAVVMLEEVVDLWSKMLPDLHVDLWPSIVQLAKAYEGCRRVPDAVNLLEQAVRRPKSGGSSPLKVQMPAYRVLADLYMDNGRVPEAVALLEEVVQASPLSELVQDYEYMLVHFVLARAHYKEERFVEALARFQAVAKFQEHTLPRNHVMRLMTQQMVAVCQWRLGDFRIACDGMRRVVEAFIETTGEEDENRQSAERQLWYFDEHMKNHELLDDSPTALTVGTVAAASLYTHHLAGRRWPRFLTLRFWSGVPSDGGTSDNAMDAGAS